MKKSELRNLIREVLNEGNFGKWDINNTLEFGTKYKDFIDKVIKSNKRNGKYVGYSFDVDNSVWIIQERGMIKFSEINKPLIQKTVHK